ncbi:MAG: Dna2/Cas4 domain-containing protein [Nitrosopumilaceae archaeon]
MMGDRDYRQVIKNTIDSISREIEPQIDAKDTKIIHLHEVVRCLRRSYYDRVDSLEPQRTSFNNLVGGLLRKMQYGSKLGEYVIEDIKLKGQADIIVDDVVFIFRSTTSLPETPLSSDALYLNACLWIFNKVDGIIVYLSSDGKETSFSFTKDKRMFEETIRRVRVLNNLLEEKKVPILEPSEECSSCQYYERCYIKQKMGRGINLQDILGLKKSE